MRQHYLSLLTRVHACITSREIATKALGAMMLQGYSLKEDICETCEMPLMDFEKKLTCVVCPILKRRSALEKQDAPGEQSHVCNDAADGEQQEEKKQAATGMQKEAREAMEKAREVLDKVKVTSHEGKLDPEPSMSHASHFQLDRVESVRSYDTAAEAIHQEQWELLRSEGRLAKARRLLKGWKETGKLCAGKECHGFPLITKDSHTECMVCAGTGSRADGIYSQSEIDSASKKGFPDPEFHLNRPKASKKSEHIASNSHPPAQELQSDFESKRKIVSKEVGKRLLKGWTLLDKACPYCVMPIMTNKKQMNEICVLCGLVGKKKAIDTESEQKLEQKTRKEAPAQSNGDGMNPLRLDIVADDSLKTPSRCDPPEAHACSFVFPLHSPTKRSIVLPDYEKETGGKNRDPQASLGASFTRKDRREPEEQKPSLLKKEEIEHEEVSGDDIVATSPFVSPKQAGILTLEIPTTFDFGDEESLRDLIEAAKAVPDLEECSLLGVRRPQPSPGMEHAKLPGVHSPLSLQSRQLGPRPTITPETAPRPKGSGLMYCASKDTISVSAFNDSPFNRADGFDGREDDTYLIVGQHKSSRPSSNTHMKTSANKFWPPRSTRSVGSGSCDDAIALHELSLSFEELKGSDSGMVSLESEALDALMGRIEDTKHKLQRGNGHMDTDLRELIDGLAKTAYDMEMIERSKN